MTDKERKQLSDYRRKHFAIEFGPSQFAKYSSEENEMCLSITHNGRQWQSIGLTREEALQVLKVMQEALK